MLLAVVLLVEVLHSVLPLAVRLAGQWFNAGNGTTKLDVRPQVEAVGIRAKVFNIVR